MKSVFFLIFKTYYLSLRHNVPLVPDAYVLYSIAFSIGYGPPMVILSLSVYRGPGHTVQIFVNNALSSRRVYSNTAAYSARTYKTKNRAAARPALPYTHMLNVIKGNIKSRISQDRT